MSTHMKYKLESSIFFPKTLTLKLRKHHFNGIFNEFLCVSLYAQCLQMLYLSFITAKTGFFSF